MTITRGDHCHISISIRVGKTVCDCARKPGFSIPTRESNQDINPQPGLSISLNMVPTITGEMTIADMTRVLTIKLPGRFLKKMSAIIIPITMVPMTEKKEYLNETHMEL